MTTRMGRRIPQDVLAVLSLAVVEGPLGGLAGGRIQSQRYTGFYGPGGALQNTTLAFYHGPTSAISFLSRSDVPVNNFCSW